MTKVIDPDVNQISIHALRVEGDLSVAPAMPSMILNFYPRPPCGGRQISGTTPRHTVDISIHALRVEGDGNSQRLGQLLKNFYPRPPCGGRPLALVPLTL